MVKFLKDNFVTGNLFFTIIILNFRYDCKFHTAGKDFDWLVRQYEFIYSDFNEIVYDKFIPREDVALVFHLGSRPHLVDEQSLELPPFFLTPIKSRAHQIRCFGNLSTFIAICNPTVLSRIISINMDKKEIPYIELSAELFTSVGKACKM